MGDPCIAPDEAFTGGTRRLAVVAAWTAFALSEVYAIVSGLAYLSRGAPVESGPFLTLMAALVIAMGPFLVLSLIGVHAYAAPTRKPLAAAATVFMVLCVGLTSCINFLLLVVNSAPDLLAETVRSLFLPCRWPTPAFILDNFVWDWFFGLSMLLSAAVFSGDRLRIALRVTMAVGGVLCLAGLLWLAVSPAQGVLIGILGWGAAGPIAFLLLAKVFGRSRPGAAQ